MRYEPFRIPIIVPVALCALIGLMPSFTASAQRRATISTAPVRAQSEPAVPVIKISTTERDTPSTTLTGKRQHRPVNISTAEKVKLLQSQGAANLGSGADAPITSVSLSPRKTFVMDKAMLGFSYATYVNATNDQTVFTNKSGRIGTATLHLKVAKGERYLVDYSVGPYASGTVNYTVKFAGGEQHFSGAEPKHLLFVLEAQASGWAWLELGADQEYVLHAVEASKMQ